MEKEVKATSYRAGIKEENNIQVKGTTFGSMIKNLKRDANIDCRKTHVKETIFSEFRPGAFGVFYWNKKNGSLDAWIEWE